MHWVSEREEWLAEWGDARCVKELSFLGGDSGGVGRRGGAFGFQEDAHDVFFSDIIEVRGRCLVCRAAGSVVDIFDISPAAERLVSWRVLLPDDVAPGIGISAAGDAAGASLSFLFLTKAQTIHAVNVTLGQSEPFPGLPEFSTGLSAHCRLPSSPCSFSALGPSLAAVGCASGALRAVSLRPEGPSGYELVDASLLKRLVGGLLRPSAPPVLALAPAGGGVGGGLRLLSYAADGRLQLWEAFDRSGRLLTSTVLEQEAGTAISLGSLPHAHIRVGAQQGLACLLLRNTVYLIELPSASVVARDQPPVGLVVRRLCAPFPGASPVLAAPSRGALWGFWAGPAREQLFRLDLQEREHAVWEARALDASLVRAEDAAHRPALRRAATEGCHQSGALASAETVEQEQLAHRSVFTLDQQREVWRNEEEGYDVLRGASADAAGETRAGQEALDRAVRWWAGRVLLPGRFPHAAVVAALQDIDGRGRAVASGDLRVVVEDHLRRHAGLPGIAGLPPLGDAPGSTAAAPALSAAQAQQVASVLAAAALELLRRCDVAGRRRGQVCGIGVSTLWAPHTWRPAGDVIAGAAQEEGASACPLLLYTGGVSCVRAVHHWAERWWSTCHLSRDLSNYEKMEIENLLGMSDIIEWRACVTGWFLAQCVGGANIGLAVSGLRGGGSASAPARKLVGDVPANLETHVKRCAQWLDSPALTDGLQTLQQLLASSCAPESGQVNVAGQQLDLLQGTWPQQFWGADEQHKRLCLSDALRANIAACESEHACASMRDLLLVCVYAAQDGANDGTWAPLTKLLDQHLPLFSTINESMTLQTRSPDLAAQSLLTSLPARLGDLWAASFRTTANGQLVALRVPLASFRAMRYALLLLRCECWEALREWCSRQDLPAFAAYAAAREWLAAGRRDAARSGFEQASGSAPALAECLRHCEVWGGRRSMEVEEGPPAVAYLEHVAGLFGAEGLPEDEYHFLLKAASLVEEKAHRPLHQRLWVALFDKAVQMDKVSEACDALLRIDSFEGHLHALAQKLRSAGRIDLMLKLPDKQRSCFISNLHEHAALSPPTPGSDALLCYRHLYALHFSSQEYLKAAGIAHALYTALGRLLDGSGGGVAAAELPYSQALLLGGDCLSRAGDVPGPAGSTAAEPSAVAMALSSGGGVEAGSREWPLLDQQRSALLMLSSALALTPEKLLLTPPPQRRSAAVAAPLLFGASAAGAGPSPTWLGGGAAGAAGEAAPPLAREALEDGAQQWLLAQGSACSRGSGTFTLRDVERHLAAVEARLVLCGDGSTLDQGSAAAAARRVAELGLLALALRVAEAYCLDPWPCALQPFLGLCLQADTEGEDKVIAVAHAARGPAQSFMFVRSDAGEPLGTSGSVAQGWWQTLEHSLIALATPQSCGGRGEGVAPRHLAAEGRRLYSLVAEELLSKRPQETLPSFLQQALADGPSWVCLLRLYMKHRRLADAVDLVDKQLGTATSALSPIKTVGAGVDRRPKWTPLQDFPVSLLVQLQRAVTQEADKDRSGKLSRTASELDGFLTQFGKLLAEIEPRGPMRFER